MFPVPSVSNRSKASRISCFCSSVSSSLGLAFFLWDAAPSEGFLKLEALAQQHKSKEGSGRRRRGRAPPREGRLRPVGQRPPQPPAHTAAPGPLWADRSLPRSPGTVAPGSRSGAARGPRPPPAAGEEGKAPAAPGRAGPHSPSRRPVPWGGSSPGRPRLNAALSHWLMPLRRCYGNPHSYLVESRAREALRR